LRHLFLCLGCFVEHYCIPKIFWMFICGFYYFILPLSFWDKKGKSFYFWIGYVFSHKLFVFVPEWPKREFFFNFIGYILVNKNNPYSRHWIFRDTVIQSKFWYYCKIFIPAWKELYKAKSAIYCSRKGRF